MTRPVRSGMVLNLERFFAQESCGWCTPVLERTGMGGADARRPSKQGQGAARRSRAAGAQYQLLGPGHTFCALAPGAVEPLQSALKFFREISSGTFARSAARGDQTMATVHIDGPAYQVDAAENLLHACLSLGLRSALLLLAPGDGFGRRLPAVRGQAVQRRTRHARQDRDGLHDAGRRRHAHLDRRYGRASTSAPASSSG